MVLTSKEITQKQIVQRPQPEGSRQTTYDATVGTIIFCGKVIDGDSFTLTSRGVVWVVSAEDLHIPTNVTGVATLRTSWAHEGVFALNVGLVDPGWQGPVATALVNFGRDDFVVTKGAPFMRVFFLESQDTSAQTIAMDRAHYIKDVLRKSRAFSETFLNMSSLVDEVAAKVFKLPKWAFWVTWLALVLSFISIFAPIAISMWTDHVKDQVAVGSLERRVQRLEDQSINISIPVGDNARISNNKSAKTSSGAGTSTAAPTK